MMNTWSPITLLPILLLLPACSQDAEPPEEVVDTEEVLGVSLTEAVVEEPSELEAPTDDTDSRATGDAAMKAMGEELLGTKVTGIDDLGTKGIKVEKGVRAIAWRDISLEGEEIEDILDKLLYPDQYKPEEFNMPKRVQDLDGKEVAIVGYQIPLEWEDTTVPEFMLVGDLLGCCFGGAPMPDEWINVKMKGKGAEYFPYIPVIVRGILRVEGIEDEAGYAAGCYHIEAVSVEKEL